MFLGAGDDLQADFLAIAGAGVEVMLEGSQTMVLDAHRLALDFTGAVAALIDQHLQYPAAADLRQVARLGLGHRLLRPGQTRTGRPCRQQREAQHDQQKQRSGHPLQGPRVWGWRHSLQSFHDN
ncbi:hypothetical protein D3C85_1286450 [compost metagenome]